jgi:AcrR family transcriptional regulator
MAQSPKPHVRDGLLEAMRGLLVEVGYASTTVAAVAARAGVATGNVYRYFPSKEALFEAAIPASLAREIARRIRARVVSLGTARDVEALPPGSSYALVSEELFEVVLGARLSVAFLLLGAAGTPHAGFAPRLVRDLVRLARAYARSVYGLRFDGPQVFVLTRLYTSYVTALGEALATYTAENTLRAVTSDLARYHLAGLRALFVAHEKRPPKETS